MCVLYCDNSGKMNKFEEQETFIKSLFSNMILFRILTKASGSFSSRKPANVQNYIGVVDPDVSNILLCSSKILTTP